MAARIWKPLKSYPQHELIVLRDIHVSGGSTNHAVVRQLICDGMIVDGEYLELTANGRRMLVRGSPSLWDTAA
jgi:hypothetical protein